MIEYPKLLERLDEVKGLAFIVAGESLGLESLVVLVPHGPNNEVIGRELLLDLQVPPHFFAFAEGPGFGELVQGPLVPGLVRPAIHARCAGELS